MASNESSDVPESDIAIVGMGVRVPGARTAHEFWENLRGGRRVDPSPAPTRSCWPRA